MDALTAADELRLRRRLADAESRYRDLLSSSERFGAATGLAFTLLAQGRISEAWPYFEARKGRHRILNQRLSKPEWRGEPLRGRKLLIWREQGLGDQILMARFLPMLDAETTYAGPHELARLFAPLLDNFRVVEDQLNISDYDFWTQTLSLPARLGISSDSLPRAPYLHASVRAVGSRIGVMHRGNPRNANDPYRSLPRGLAERLLKLPGVMSLDPAETGAEDLLETAEIIQGLDLVISVDTSVAHLAGALGKPLWLLRAAHGYDWQWPEPDPAFWYPSAKAYCQRVPGEWEDVVERITSDLS